jgi:hypothetical protein
LQATNWGKIDPKQTEAQFTSLETEEPKTVHIFEKITANHELVQGYFEEGA